MPQMLYIQTYTKDIWNKKPETFQYLIFLHIKYFIILLKNKVYQLLNNIDYDKANATAFLKRNTNGQI